MQTAGSSLCALFRVVQTSGLLVDSAGLHVSSLCLESTKRPNKDHFKYQRGWKGLSAILDPGNTVQVKVN